MVKHILRWHQNPIFLPAPEPFFFNLSAKATIPCRPPPLSYCLSGLLTHPPTRRFFWMLSKQNFFPAQISWHFSRPKAIYYRLNMVQPWRDVRAGRRSSPAKRVYGLKPVSRVQIPPSPPEFCAKSTSEGRESFVFNDSRPSFCPMTGNKNKEKPPFVCQLSAYASGIRFPICISAARHSGLGQMAEINRHTVDVLLKSI